MRIKKYFHNPWVIVCYITSLWSFAFFLDYLLPLRDVNCRIKNIIVEQQSSRRGSSYITNFVYFEELKMPVDLEESFALKPNMLVKLSKTCLTNLPYKITWLDNGREVEIYANAGIHVHFIFLPVVILITGVVMLIDKDKYDVIKLIIINLFMTFLALLMLGTYFHIK